jgi:hypothetical protein
MNMRSSQQEQRRVLLAGTESHPSRNKGSSQKEQRVLSAELNRGSSQQEQGVISAGTGSHLSRNSGPYKWKQSADRSGKEGDHK